MLSIVQSIKHKVTDWQLSGAYDLRLAERKPEAVPYTTNLQSGSFGRRPTGFSGSERNLIGSFWLRVLTHESIHPHSPPPKKGGSLPSACRWTDAASGGELQYLGITNEGITNEGKVRVERWIGAASAVTLISCDKEATKPKGINLDLTADLLSFE